MPSLSGRVCGEQEGSRYIGHLGCDSPLHGLLIVHRVGRGLAVNVPQLEVPQFF